MKVWQRWRRQKKNVLQKATPLATGTLLKGRTALITGAGRNIGRAIALELASQGATILFTETDEARCEALTAVLQEHFGQGRGYTIDISNLAACDAFCTQLAKEKKIVDILIHNVAYQPASPLAQTSSEAWQVAMQTNVIGPMYLTRRVVQQLITNKSVGDVLFITSLHQWLPSGWPAYSASKGALAMIVKELAVEFSPHAIRVNGIAPGWVHETRKKAKLALLHQETIDPVYIGRAALFLVSDYFSHYTTGTILKVDAGMSLYSGRIPFALPKRSWWRR